MTFVGYSNQRKAWTLIDHEQKQIVESSHVQFGNEIFSSSTEPVQIVKSSPVASFFTPLVPFSGTTSSSAPPLLLDSPDSDSSYQTPRSTEHIDDDGAPNTPTPTPGAVSPFSASETFLKDAPMNLFVVPDG